MQEETRANRYLVPRGDEPYESLLEIKRSEFIGHIKRVSTCLLYTSPSPRD